MKIHEFQAKELLRGFGARVPQGKVTSDPAKAAQICQDFGGRCVVKAQIHAGGRGKGGGVRLAAGPEEAERLAGEILGMQLATHQTGPEGQRVRKVLIEEAIEIDQELYLGVTLDRAAERPVLMASRSGGMDIEEVARTDPGAILRELIDPQLGVLPFQCRRIASGLGYSGGTARQIQAAVASVVTAYLETDASLVEINPLMVDSKGDVYTLDAKMNFDDNAMFRRPEIAGLRDIHEENPLEVEASKYGISYIKLDGSIGCMVNGAGLAMATMDIIKLYGGEPANFLDVGGSASQEAVASAFPDHPFGYRGEGGADQHLRRHRAHRPHCSRRGRGDRGTRRGGLAGRCAGHRAARGNERRGGPERAGRGRLRLRRRRRHGDRRRARGSGPGKLGS